jgi:putative ATPase
MAINRAQKAIKEGEIPPIPDHIKTHAKPYRYPHDFGGWVAQSYLDTSLHFYETKQIGFEKTLYEWHQKITSKKD